MNAQFFALAFAAALNPKLLALDLLLIENRRPRAMFWCVLVGAAIVALTIGLVDVLTVKADAISSQKKASAAVDLALGLLLLAAAGLLAVRRGSRKRRRQPVPGNSAPPEQPKKKDSWAARALAEPRLGLAMLVGALIGLPGASYLDACPGRLPYDRRPDPPGLISCPAQTGSSLVIWSTTCMTAWPGASPCGG